LALNIRHTFYIITERYSHRIKSISEQKCTFFSRFENHVLQTVKNDHLHWLVVLFRNRLGNCVGLDLVILQTSAILDLSSYNKNQKYQIFETKFYQELLDPWHNLISLHISLQEFLVTALLDEDQRSLRSFELEILFPT